jgi:hypothetical protein
LAFAPILGGGMRRARALAAQGYGGYGHDDGLSENFAAAQCR